MAWNMVFNKCELTMRRCELTIVAITRRYYMSLLRHAISVRGNIFILAGSLIIYSNVNVYIWNLFETHVNLWVLSYIIWYMVQHVFVSAIIFLNYKLNIKSIRKDYLHHKFATTPQYFKASFDWGGANKTETLLFFSTC